MSKTAEEIRREYYRKWRREHADKVREYTRNYWQRRADQINEELQGDYDYEEEKNGRK